MIIYGEWEEGSDHDEHFTEILEFTRLCPIIKSAPTEQVNGITSKLQATGEKQPTRCCVCLLKHTTQLAWLSIIQEDDRDTNILEFF